MDRSRRMIVGMIAGVAAGLLARMGLGDHPLLAAFNDTIVHVVGQVFLRLIFMVVVPLVVASLVLGVVELGDVRRLGRLGLWALAFTALLSGTSVAIGVGLVGAVRPGEMVAQTTRDELKRSMAPESGRVIAQVQAARGPVDAILGLIPRNPLQAAVGALEGELLGLMVFSLIAGVALGLVAPERRRPLVELAEGVLAVAMKIIDMAMALAPLGVGALLFSMVVRTGAALFTGLAGYVLVVVGGLAAQQFVVYPLVLRGLAGVGPGAFFGKVREAMLTAFSTASSSATLPTTLRVSEENLGIPRRIGNFVLTVGATANQNGTALFEGVTVLFLAQIFGVTLTLEQQARVVLMSVLAGIGTAGIPGGSIPMVVIILQSVGIPAEGIGIVLGVDRFLDMCRTTLNVTGDLVIATLVARWDSARRGPDDG